MQEVSWRVEGISKDIIVQDYLVGGYATTDAWTDTGGFNGIIARHKIGLLLFARVSTSWEVEVVVVNFDSDGTSNRLCGKIIVVRLSFEMITYGNKLAFMGWGWWLMELWGSGQFSILLDTGLCVDQTRRMRLDWHTTTFYALHTGNIEEEVFNWIIMFGSQLALLGRGVGESWELEPMMGAIKLLDVEVWL